MCHTSRRYPARLASRFLLHIVLCLSVPCLPSISLAENQPEIRLLLDEGLTRSVVQGLSIVVERQDGNKWRKVVDRVRRVGFSPDPAGVRLDGTGRSAAIFRVWTRSGTLQYRGKEHRGSIHIHGAGGSLTAVVVIPLEAYLVGVVNGEIDSGWPIEAVRAQVVAARSFAVHRISTGSPLYDVRSDTTDQVYAGMASEDDRAARAVRSTRGEVLYRDGNVLPAFFHSSCGGSTSSSSDIWGMPNPSLEGVECGLCSDSPRSRWELSTGPSEVVEVFRTLFPLMGNARSFGIHKRTSDGRALTLFVDTDRGRTLVDAGDFRKVMGYRKLLSTRFSLAVAGDRVIFRGAGYGHGVGLCQWGARGGALRGMNYRQILGKYYRGAEVRKAY